MAAAGAFVVLEGGEGSGKSTQARLLAEALTAAGLEVVLTREPGGAPGADLLRHVLLDSAGRADWTPLSEALLHYAARNEHLETTIRPALAGGAWVVCDRFADSTEAYQGGGQGVDSEALRLLRALVVGATEPDLTFVLDVPVDLGLARARARASAAAGQDRYEALDEGFHARVRATFLRLAGEGDRRMLIDARGDAAEVHRVVRCAVADRLGVRGL